MSEQQQPSRTSKFLSGAGEVQDKRLWGPAKWIVQMIQYLIAIIMITIGEGLKAIFTGEKPRSSQQRDEAARRKAT
ncbi:hypothetical protein LTR85_011236 [Meristemomyces frigidus]|nr:hypothetical protein LTR85_011236 [Meristemomyces frigidus]